MRPSEVSPRRAGAASAATLPTAMLLASALAAFPAVAQDRPPLEPTRDFAATYRMLGNGDDPMRIGMSWRTAERVMRVDLPAIGPMAGSYLLHDRAGGGMRMVMAAQRMVMEMPAEAAAAQGIPTAPGPNARYVRLGGGTVAGRGCTEWRFEDGTSKGTACISAEGIMLRARGGEGDAGGGLEATEVTLAPQDAARFRVPAGFQAMRMPAAIPGGLPGGPPGGPPGTPRK